MCYNIHMKKLRSGFTVLEIIIVLAVVAIGTTLFFTTKVQTDAIARDSQRKTAINAMYFALEEDFFAHNGFYPEQLGPDTLKSIDPNLFTDPLGENINTADSSFIYEPTSCLNGECQHYTLRAILEREDEFIRSSRN
jgi:prepilin-type N-terminal cleavage/methylation domain-containing protein